jgi:mannose/fructose/N-acetylgalactosamine-specific phosphotransferase system component IIB
MADSGKVVLLVALTRIKLERCIRKSVDENINPVKVLISFFAINMTLKIQLKNIEIELLNLGNFFKSRNQENAGRPFRACTTEIALMNFLVLYREKQKEKNLILSFSTPQQVTPTTT